MNSTINDFSFSRQFLILAVTFLFFFGLAQIISAIGFSLTGNISDLQNLKNITALKWVQIFASLISFVAPAMLFSFLKQKEMFSYHLFKNKVSPTGVILTIILIFVSYAFLSQTYLFNKEMVLPSFLSDLEAVLKLLEEQAEAMMQSFLEMNSIGDLLLNLFMAGAVAAFAEEIFFRGTLQKFLREWIKNPHLAILITSVLFSFGHFQFYGFLPRMLIGILLGYLFYWSKNLWYPILAHFVFNGSQVVAYYFAQKGIEDINPNEIESIPTFVWLLSMLGTLVLSYLAMNYFQEKEVNISNGERLGENI